MNRKEFITTSIFGTSALLAPGFLNGCRNHSKIPSYLEAYKASYHNEPLNAAINWFKNAKFGLFMHYGLYSQLGQGEWIQYHQKIRVKEYEKLMNNFQADNFDTDFITDLAIRAGMKYVNITTRHHDSFSLFNTKQNDFNSVNSPAKRDLVEELANDCAKKGLGLALYYSHGRDWRHPHAPNNDVWGGKARPEYDPPETSYKYGKEHDLNKYIEFMHRQLEELLTQYGPIASIWLDGFGVPMSGPTEKFRIQETYDLIRSIQPQCLISSKWGYLGNEDYLAPEIHWIDKKYPTEKEQEEFRENLEKPLEFCSNIAGWGYHKGRDGKHRGAKSIWQNDICYAAKFNANLLLNIAPRPDGSIDPQDIESLEIIGSRMEKDGWPSECHST